jgi:translation elongation factor EF-Ts
MKSNKIYHIKLIEEIVKTNSAENDFSNPIYSELSDIIEVEEAEYIWVSDNDELYIRLDENKFKRILATFEKYYILTTEDITDKVVGGEIEKMYSEIELVNEDFFTNFRLENTSVDDLLDKISTRGIDSLDTIDKSILSSLKD